MMSAVPMEARTAASLPRGRGWWFEPKWDGFRCLAFRDRGEIVLQAKSGKRLGRYFPEVVERLSALATSRFALDGELVIPRGRRFSFEALQMRLHPAASRIARLARETPVTYVLFDMLMGTGGEDLRARSLRRRQKALADFHAAADDPGLALTPGTADRPVAEHWLESGTLEGVVAKRLDGSYAEGERAMVKVKRARTADCVVGGFRYGTGSRQVASLLLGLYDDAGLLNHVGFTSGLAAADKGALTRALEALAGGAGFTGAAPGGPSRWSTERSGQWTPLHPEMVVEVSFDHVSAGRFRHGTRLVRFRADKAPEQCRMDQIAPTPP